MLDNIFQYIASFLFVIALIVMTAWALRRFLSHSGIPSIALLKPKNSRVEVLEVTMVDAQRRLVLVRRDDVEHLVLTGGASDLVIERDIPHKKVEPEDKDNESKNQIVRRNPNNPLLQVMNLKFRNKTENS